MVKIIIPLDKMLHFLVGFFLASLTTVFVHDPTWGILTAIVAGFLKECYDKWIKKTRFDYLDWWATGFGGVVLYLFRIFEFLF